MDDVTTVKVGDTIEITAIVKTKDAIDTLFSYLLYDPDDYEGLEIKGIKRVD